MENTIPYIMEGQVVATDDPDQMGRVKVWVPALDGETFNIDNLPWAEYASPFMGFTVDYPAGTGSTKNTSHQSYGFWAIPKIGATVLVFCLNGVIDSRYYFASTLRLHRNRSLPAGRNTDFNGKVGPFGDAGDGKGNLNPVQPAYDNLRTQFAGNVGAPQAISRGVYERQVAQAKNEKDGAEGYGTSPLDPTHLDPQTYCLVSPGRHAIIMQDDPHFSRLRLKTAEGHQVIFDDANERIYMSTAKGDTWVELDQDGHIHIYGSSSVSIRSGEDINLYADNNINMEAGNSVNVKANSGDVKVSAGGSLHLKAAGDMKQSACGLFEIDGEDSIHMTAAADLDLYSGNSLAAFAKDTIELFGMNAINQQGTTINLNGTARVAEQAQCPEPADGPSVVPGHEPWVRPATAGTRNKNWKE